MRTWRCLRCGSHLLAEDDDDLMFVALGHVCEPPKGLIRRLVDWLTGR